jgi:energy-coupling factor transport system substrate-specific component
VKNAGQTTRTVAALAVSAALLFGFQVAKAAFMPFLPNVEVVSLLVMLFTVTFRHKVLFIIYIFVLLEGIYYGFGLWWVTYLYVWTILALVTWLCRSFDSLWIMAAVAGVFGLLFGAMDAIPYIFISGFPSALARWISGIPFDLVHCAGNVVLCLALWIPLRRVLTRCVKTLRLS